ncbi:MAG: transposase [Cyanobacteria bacterium DS2.3.42]|nr:transposase [Cyanobacteria bacterium DS2.3.42]
MIIRRSYYFQLKANASQRTQLSRFAGCCRLVWNKGLELQKKRLDQQKRPLTYAEECAELIGWKKEIPFLQEIHSQPLQQTLKNLDRAMKDGLSNDRGFPKFKKKGQKDSFRYPQGTKLDDDKIYLPKIGWVKFRKSREIEGTVKNVTVSKNAGKWYISIQVEMEVPEPIHPATSAVGIDLGVTKFATLSDGTVLESINSGKKLKKKLARQQRTLSRRTKFSANWKEQKAKIQKTHSKIANVRNDYLHKASSEMSKNHALIILEDLKVRSMTKSAKGTEDAPSKNVAAKSGLNRSILDQGWYEFKRQLKYKQEWAGGMMILVNPKHTSQTCSMCSHTAAENRQSQSQFQCVNCGYLDNADLNAAKNILAAGRAALACGDIGRNAA